MTFRSHWSDLNRDAKEDHSGLNCRYYEIGGITLQVESEIPFTDQTFHPKFKQFEVPGPGSDTVVITHRFGLPDLSGLDLGQEVYRKPPWAIYRNGHSWVYVGISPREGDSSLHKLAIFDGDHTRGTIYNTILDEARFRNGGMMSLTLFPTDQVLLARVLADHQGCYLHSAGVILDGRGMLFVGHSEAGKSTLVNLLKERAEIICDDRNIVRRWHDGFRVHGTWSHGEVPLVSSMSAPLTAVFLLRKASQNCIVPIRNRRVAVRNLLACLIKPLVTADWWEKMLALIENIVREVPCYELHFDKSGKVIDSLVELQGTG